MRHRPTAVAAVTAAAAVTLALGGAPTAAQQPDLLPIAVDPGRVPAGTDVTISGDGCIDDTPTGVVVEVTYLGDDAELSFSAPWEVADDGSWAARYRINEDDPVGSYAVQATCYNQVSSDPPSMSRFFDYAPGTFEVTTAPVVPEVLPMTVDPTSGPVGTTIDVSGTACPGGQLYAWLFAGHGLADATAIVDEAYITADAAGAWNGELVVYDTMLQFPFFTSEVDVVPGDGYSVQAVCFITEDLGNGVTRELSIFADPVAFEITPGGTAPPRDNPPTPSVVQQLRPQAQPATPVSGDPSYTG
jgi:hypothetical protein